MSRYWISPQLKRGTIRVIFPNFQNCACCEKYLEDNKHDSLHLARKYARIFVLEHYPFLKAHSFPPATFSEQITSAVPNGGQCLYTFVYVNHVYFDKRSQSTRWSTRSYASNPLKKYLLQALAIWNWILSVANSSNAFPGKYFVQYKLILN